MTTYIYGVIALIERLFMKDYILSVFIGLCFAVLALAYFDVLIK